MFEKREGRWDSASSTLNLKDVHGYVGERGSTHLIDELVISAGKLELKLGGHSDHTIYTFVRKRGSLEMSKQMASGMSLGREQPLFRSDIQKLLNLFFAFYYGNKVQKEIYTILYSSGWMNFLMYVANNVRDGQQYKTFAI